MLDLADEEVEFKDDSVSTWSQWGLTPLQKNVDNLGGGRRSARPLRAGRAAGRSRAGGPWRSEDMAR